MRFGLSDSNWSGRKLSPAAIERPFLSCASPLSVFSFGPPLLAANTMIRSGAAAIRESAAPAKALYPPPVPPPQLLLATGKNARLPALIAVLCVATLAPSIQGFPQIAAEGCPGPPAGTGIEMYPFKYSQSQYTALVWTPPPLVV